MENKSEKMSLKGVIFDIDGVVVNTVPLHFKAWKRMFGEYQKRFTLKDYKEKVDGIPRIEGTKAILTELSEDELIKAADKKQEYFLQFLEIEGIQVFEDAINLIKQLKGNNIKVAAISSSKNCLYILKKANILDLFDAIITGNDIKKGKPDPEIFLLATKKMGLYVSECIVFEDAVLGVEAAKRGGFVCVGVDRYQRPERLTKADLVINELSKTKLETLRQLLIK